MRDQMICKDRDMNDAAMLQVEQPGKSLSENPCVSDGNRDHRAPCAGRAEGPDGGKWDPQGLLVCQREA